MVKIANVMWETQVALYNALIVNTRFMNYIGNRLYAIVPTNEVYPYVKQDITFSIPDKTHDKKGYEVITLFKIYTKPDSQGNYPSFLIFRELNKTLHKKVFLLDNYNMIICKLDSRETVEEKDNKTLRKTINAYYKIFVQEK